MAETVQKVFKKEDMVTVPEFAKAIHVSRSHAYQLVEKGQAAEIGRASCRERV